MEDLLAVETQETVGEQFLYIHYNEIKRYEITDSGPLTITNRPDLFKAHQVKDRTLGELEPDRWFFFEKSQMQFTYKRAPSATERELGVSQELLFTAINIDKLYLALADSGINPDRSLLHVLPLHHFQHPAYRPDTSYLGRSAQTGLFNYVKVGETWDFEQMVSGGRELIPFCGKVLNIDYEKLTITIESASLSARTMSLGHFCPLKKIEEVIPNLTPTITQPSIISPTIDYKALAANWKRFQKR